MRVGNITRGPKGHVLAVVGAQYGSEGKGVIVNHIARQYNVHVRTGGPNAGHSFYHQGVKYVMQVLPCGWTNPNAALVIGRGMLLDLAQLKKELAIVEAVYPDVRERIFIDEMCGVLDDRHKLEEGGVDGELHARIGSTGKGVGAARRARMDRDNSRIKLFTQVADEEGLADLLKNDTPAFLRGALDHGDNILLEGTQGSALSLTHGPWPYVTSHDTNAAQLAADCGIPPRFVSRTLLVARTYPIRVAGNSGPMFRETDWDAISARVGRPVTEQTTVTKKTRRVAEWDPDLLDRAVILNGPTSIALTFADYMDPLNEGVINFNDLDPSTREFIRGIEVRTMTPVSFVGTGGPGWRVIDRGIGV